jgi:hypothetical protein
VTDTLPRWCSKCHRVAIREPHDCARCTRLSASAGTVAFAPAAVQLVAKASSATRTVSGLVIPWEEFGETSMGRLIAGQGSIRWPEDLTRVKLMDYHQDPAVAIGYATQLQATASGLVMTFHIPETPLGDQALLEASNHLRDAFSVELSDITLQGDRIADSMLSAVALLPVPAYASARVDSVTAALSSSTTQPTKGTTMTDEQKARLRELLAAQTLTPEQQTELAQLSQLAAQELAGTDTPPADTPPPPAQAGQLAAGANPELVASIAQALVAAQSGATPMSFPGSQGGLAQAPQGLQVAGGNTPRPVTDLYAAMTRVARGESKPQLEAALTSITQTANAFTTQDEYAGQLWQALTYTRRFVNLLQQSDLKSYKGNGWKWGVAPAVAAYAGDKAAVPSNSPTTVNVPWTASRLAGAHDLDRKFRDFGDDEFFQAYYEAMTLSYAMLSDQAARDFIIASATAGTAVTGGLLVSVAKVAARLNVAINDAGVDYVLVNDQDKIGLLSTTAASIPAFLEDFVNIKPGAFIGTPSVPAGTIIVGNKNAGAFKELPGSPIRAEVVDMVNGGVDGGVFGYYAAILNMPTAIQKAAWT